jgi:hypothetical protein
LWAQTAFRRTAPRRLPKAGGVPSKLFEPAKPVQKATTGEKPKRRTFLFAQKKASDVFVPVKRNVRRSRRIV